MPITQSDITKMDIRGELSLLYAVSKLIISILDTAAENKIACETLRSASETLLNQAAYVCGKVSFYSDELKGSP